MNQNIFKNNKIPIFLYLMIIMYESIRIFLSHEAFSVVSSLVMIFIVSMILFYYLSNQKEKIRIKDQMKSILENAKSIIYIKDLNDKFLDINPAFMKFYGMRRDQILDKTNDDLISSDQAEIIRNHEKIVIQTRKAHSFEEEIAFNQFRFYFRNTIFPLFNISNQLYGIGAIMTDITDKKMVENELRELNGFLEAKVKDRTEKLMKSEKKYRTIFENIQDIFFQTDLKGIITEISPSIKSYTHKTRNDFIGGNIDNLYEHPEDLRKMLRLMRKERSIRDFEVQTKFATNKVKWVSINSHFILNEKGDRCGIEGIMRDITHRKQIEEELEKQNIELHNAKIKAEAATQAKSEFLANMSHEIRTPMNAILGFSEVLNTKIEDPSLKNYIESINAGGKTLLQLINDILDLSKIEAGKMELNYASVNIKHIFYEMKQIFNFKVKEKGIDFILNIEPELPEALELDEVRLRQILLNLIGNAVKFTSSGSIKVSAHKLPSKKDSSRLTLCFEIRDSGIGIAKDQMELIFDAFQQQAGQDNTQYGGTGLGLTITKRLVEMMGGNIELESQLNEGSIFRVILNDVAISSIQNIRDFKKDEASEVTFHGGSVMVVDDIVSNRSLVRSFLKSTNLEVIEAIHGKDAIEKAKTNHPDVILMDIKMPVMNGYKAVKVLKSDMALKHIPVIILTASAMKRDEKRIQDIGADGYLRKPVSRLELIKELSQHLAHITHNMESSQISVDHVSLYGDIDYNAVHRDEWLKAIHIIENKHMGQWKEVKDTVILNEIELFAQSIYTVGQSMDVKPVKDWGQQLLNKTSNFEMGFVHKMIQGFPDYIAKIKRNLEFEGVYHE